MILIHAIYLSYFLAAVLGAPIGQGFNPYSAFDDAFNATWSTFWNWGQQGWTGSSCPGDAFAPPALWDSAVAGGAAVATKNPWLAQQVTTQLLRYKNAETGGYSATTAGDKDMYTDDNAQVIWVYIDAYGYTGNSDYLQEAQNILSFIKSQWVSNGGGVKWSYTGDYIASISNAEAALAALKIYEYSHDDSDLEFAKTSINWLADNLEDPSDHLFYDGKTISSGAVNKGKLSYTVGVAISAYAYLYKFENDSKWLQKANVLVNASAKGTGVLYAANGYWNNQLKYLNLLFSGLADFANISPNSIDQWKTQQSVVQEINRQAKFIYSYYQDGTSGTYFDDISTAPQNVYAKYAASFSTSESSSPASSCSNGATKLSLLTQGSAARIFYDVWRA
ncbi:hypothetical protein CAAN1_01S04038 [[Candida] anglica]|uniref:Glycoside hydrolase family 76 protein n=1 Tax=[Candida] anglica TaxID=148631 RepID=A0ABP0EMY8_9ASCO